MNGERCRWFVTFRLDDPAMTFPCMGRRGHGKGGRHLHWHTTDQMLIQWDETYSLASTEIETEDEPQVIAS